MKTVIKDIFRRLSLVQKFSVVVVFLIIIIMLVFNTLIITYQKNVLRSEMDKNRFLIVRNLAKEAVEPLVFMDPLRLDELVRTTAQAPGCAYAGIVDQNKRFVGHTDRKLLGQVLPDGIQQKGAVGATTVEDRVRDIEEEGVKEVLVPVKAGYDVIGMTLVGFSRNETDAVIEQNLKGLKRYILLISAAVLLLGIWGAFGLARFLTTPIKKLKDQMELVQRGDLNVAVSNEHLMDCWDALGCEVTHCPAYGRKRCWTVPGTLCYGEVQGSVFEKIGQCKKCIVYKESCGDEIGELVEVFNQMIGKLNQSIRQLEEASAEKSRLEKLSALGEMSMTVAHEIKNPLNAIRGAASYLRNNFEGEVLKEFLSVIEEETKRLNEIVTSFLRFSKPTPLNLQRADINMLVREITELVRQEATENNVEVITTLDEKIPSFLFDHQQIKQALLNILVNSLDATRPGDSVRIATEIADSRIHVMIRDTGSGIPQDVVSEIFKPFFTTKTRGSGLGLACVERIVKDHRGDISVSSEIMKGTEFRITLPLAR